MDAFEQTFNDFLVNVFNSILKSEESLVRRSGAADISISELHLLDAVSRCRPPRNTVSDLAAALDITNPSVTVAVNKLVKKGCLAKERSGRDGRAVQITLTPEGAEINALHQEFHRRMVHSAAAHLSQEEKSALLSGIRKLSVYFDAAHFQSLLQDSGEI